MGAGVAGGKNVVEGARSPLFGVLGVDLEAGIASPPVLFLVFPTGNAGSATVGGPLDGRAGLGNAVDIFESDAKLSRMQPYLGSGSRKPANLNRSREAQLSRVVPAWSINS